MAQLSFFDPLPVVAPQTCDLHSYDRYVVMFSGGKDSVALYLALREAGVDNAKIELWHHPIDGYGERLFMDWPCTTAYCSAFAAAFGVPLYLSWRDGGFERELLRDNDRTASVFFEQPGGKLGRAGGTRGGRGTRRRFPQVSANLAVRWCSGALKIDVAAAALRNQARFLHSRTLVLTGERAGESTARANYACFEPHRTDRHSSVMLRRHVNHLRLVHSWSEADVWAILARWRINPHPAYRLGWSRVSCAGCIFGNADQWASLRAVNPKQFARIAAYEHEFGLTIRRDRRSIVEAANVGTPYAAITPALITEALDSTWNGPIILPEGMSWTLPAGAFGTSAGPS